MADSTLEIDLFASFAIVNTPQRQGKVVVWLPVDVIVMWLPVDVKHVYDITRYLLYLRAGCKHNWRFCLTGRIQV